MIQARNLAPVAPPKGRFHRLRVTALDPVADDALAVTLTVPQELAPAFTFRAGQHITLRFALDGVEQRRSYSICTPAPAGPLRVGVRLLPGGLVSTHIHRALRIGDDVEAMEPAGAFTLALEPGRQGRYVALAAGSGITPVLSLVSTALAQDPAAVFTVAYSNRTAGSAMFLDELAELKDRWPSRLQLVHLFSRERQTVEVRNGRLDSATVRCIADQLVDAARIDRWFLCGPFGMVTQARATLAGLGVDPSRVRTELFFVEAQPPQRSIAEETLLRQPGQVDVTARLNGRETTFTMTRAQALVDGLLAARDDAPFSCKGGVCATCRARLLEGRVAMDHTYALDSTDREQGYILTCQAHPLTDRVVVDYDA